MGYLILILLALVALTSGFTAMRPKIVRMGVSDMQMISHGKSGVKRLGRPADQRKALVRGLTTEVIRHGRIRTTVTKAKAIR
jgi:hypothetical protein